MSVLSAEKARCLSLGVSALDNVFPGFELGDFAVLHGHLDFSMLFVLCVRCELAHSRGGLGSPVIFADGGNSFNPYLIADVARSYGLDSRTVLEKIYVSRAFTPYQLSSLIFEDSERILSRKKAKLLVVSDITSLFFDENIPKDESEDLFTKVCTKLSEIAAKKQAIVIVSYRQDGGSMQGLFFEAVLLGKSNVLVRFRKTGKILSFVLEDHPRIKSFSIDFPTEYTSLTAFMKE